ncbi:unnamed protein product [Urochloa decumbens]|uniref:DUF4408 domain-containing protein n=1 Tax=Urochloa decumbens TaxID=240449 RepID=A0ABC9DIT5_9POAL
MLEVAIPALWSAVHGFFTPAVLFVVLNIVIGTIAVTSKVTASPAAGEGEDAAAAGAGGGEEQQHQQYRRLSRVPSMAFERLRSFNLNRFAAPAPEPAVAGEVDLGYEHPPAPAVEKEEEEPVVVGAGEPEAEPEMEPEPVSAHALAHVERSLSEAAAEPELPRLPARLHKSASDRSAFAHFEAEEVEEAVREVEARRPATTREGARRGRGRELPVAEPDSSDSEPEEEDAAHGGGEVDALADAFINKFRNELKLQRLESFIRHRETVRRGQAAAAGV